MDNPERTLLCWKATRLIHKYGMVDLGYYDCDSIQEFSLAGFAYYYLAECWDHSKSINKANVTLYKQLLEIDTKLGITQSEQLFACLLKTLRMDLIQV